MNKHKILYVEDEVVVILGISKELEAEGYEVTTASSGEKALKLLEKEAFDLVITDAIMGKIDGFEVVKKAKELYPETITMILTGYNETDFAIKALRLGIDDYMLKPYETEDFLFRVQRCLEKGELQKKKQQADEALRESEERYRSIFESAPIGIFHTTPEGKFISANPAIARIYGYESPDELMTVVNKSSVAEALYVHPKKRPPAVDMALGEETWILFENQYRRKDGEIIIGKLLYRAVRNPDGSTSHLEGFIEDITERKRAEEALRVSEERFILVAQGSSDGIWDWDIQNNSLYWSPRLKESLGYADDELDVDFDTFDSLLHPDDRAHVKAAIEAHLKDRVPYDVEERLRTKSGDYRWFHIRGHTIWDEAGNPIRMAGSNIDITERKKAEKQIKASLREKEVLLQEIHHRVRNNMQVVSSLLKLQAGKMKDEKIRQALKESQSRVSAMALVHETLYRSKSMAEIELQKHISALVDSVYRTFRIKQKVKLHVDVEDIKLSIGQATPLSLVINELISNSLQHAFPEGKGEISVKLNLRGEDKIEVVIGDNGRGMPEHIDYDKTLGLQLVKGLVESQLEGTLDIKTKAGTKHTIRFKKKE